LGADAGQDDLVIRDDVVELGVAAFEHDREAVAQLLVLADSPLFGSAEGAPRGLQPVGPFQIAEVAFGAPAPAQRLGVCVVPGAASAASNWARASEIRAMAVARSALVGVQSTLSGGSASGQRTSVGPP
jgi:hypothetical protein